jgi:ankyrin repeat protein
LEKGASLNLPDKAGRTPFFFACQGGHVETAQCLLEALHDKSGDEINKMSNDGKTPLRKAAARGNLKIIEMLLEKIDAATAVNAKDSKLGQTPLHTAAYNGQKDVVEALLKAGADLKLTDKNGKTPLELCGQGWARSNAESAEATLLFLIDMDNETTVKCSEIMCTAAAKGSVKVIERLLDAGADPNSKDEHGWTPLLLAQQYGQDKAAEELSKKGAVIGTKPTKWVGTASTVEISKDGLELKSKGQGNSASLAEYGTSGD